MVCGGFNFFDSSCTNSVEVCGYGCNKGAVLFIEAGYFWYLFAVTEKQHPLAFNFCPVLNQTKFAGLVLRQRVRRRVGGVVGSSGNDRLVRVAVQEADDDFVADSRQRHRPSPG